MKRTIRPIHYAAQAGSARMIELCLANGADVNALPEPERWEPDSNTPLSLAALNGRREACDMLIAKGGIILGEEAIADLVVRGDHQGLKIRLEAGDDPNETRGNIPWPLWFALALGDDEARDILVEHGANLEMTRICMEYGPDEFRPDFATLKSLQYIDLMRRPEISSERQREMVELVMLREKCVELNHVSGRGALLHYTAEQGIDEVIEHLPRLSEDPPRIADRLDKARNNSLHAAARNGRVSTVKLLLELGINPQWTNADGLTPLDVAADDATRAALTSAED